MLVLTRKPGQSIMIGDGIEVQVLSVAGEKVRLGITAPTRRRRSSATRSTSGSRPSRPQSVNGSREVERRRSSASLRSRSAASAISQASVSNITTTTVTHGDRERDEQDAEPDLAARLGALNAARARAVGGALAQLLAPAPLERHLLLERQLDLSHALSHSHLRHGASPPSAGHRWAGVSLASAPPRVTGYKRPTGRGPARPASASSRANSGASASFGRDRQRPREAAPDQLGVDASRPARRADVGEQPPVVVAALGPEARASRVAPADQLARSPSLASCPKHSSGSSGVDSGVSMPM